MLFNEKHWYSESKTCYKFPLCWKKIGWWKKKRKTDKNCYAFIVYSHWKYSVCVQNVHCSYMHFKAFSNKYHNLIVQPYWYASTLCYMRIMLEPDTHTNANHIENIMASQRVRWNLFSFICHICIQMDFHYGCIPCISTRTLALGQCTALIFITPCMWIRNRIHSLLHSVRCTALYICNISLNENADDRLHFHSYFLFFNTNSWSIRK